MVFRAYGTDAHRIDFQAPWMTQMASGINEQNDGNSVLEYWERRRLTISVYGSNLPSEDESQDTTYLPKPNRSPPWSTIIFCLVTTMVWYISATSVNSLIHPSFRLCYLLLSRLPAQVCHNRPSRDMYDLLCPGSSRWGDDKSSFSLCVGFGISWITMPHIYPIPSPPFKRQGENGARHNV